MRVYKTPLKNKKKNNKKM